MRNITKSSENETAKKTNAKTKNHHRIGKNAYENLAGRERDN